MQTRIHTTVQVTEHIAVGPFINVQTNIQITTTTSVPVSSGKLQSPFFSSGRVSPHVSPFPAYSMHRLPPASPLSPPPLSPPHLSPPSRRTPCTACLLPPLSPSPLSPSPSLPLPSLPLPSLPLPCLPPLTCLTLPGVLHAPPVSCLTSPVSLSRLPPHLSPPPPQTAASPAPAAEVPEEEEAEWSDDFEEDAKEAPPAEEDLYEATNPDLDEDLYEDLTLFSAAEVPESSGRGACARALYDYQGVDDSEITFDPDDIITGIEFLDEGWWRGFGPTGHYGLFPANYVALM
ncbi:hypothetical protein CesoFtcFv8_023740 [Champsocephalus esox]|uniref:SH3 domain-containing protein n=1 Tax=Champsocephalus esox TaxID=159716 RepID=A0AAN8B4W5_9TELE|nr:hypothetical protein CesoFtcFv8_023740 [Champsocephalus esox]